MKLGFLFPGQGSQKVGMGKELIDSTASLWQQADQVMGYSLSHICFEGPDTELVKTQNAQPGLFMVSYCLATKLKEAGITPTLVAGHSLGELTAYAVAQAYDFKTALQIIQARGNAMAKAYPSEKSGMAAVIGTEESVIQSVLDTLPGPIVIANYNCPGQLVISGEKTSIERASVALKEKGAKVIPLPVSGAFHSPLMKQASEELTTFLRPITLHNASIPIVLNRTAQPETQAEALRSNLSQQVVSSVRWIETIRWMSTQVDRLVEVGSGKVLTGLVKKCVPEFPIDTISDSESLATWVSNYSKGFVS